MHVPRLRKEPWEWATVLSPESRAGGSGRSGEETCHTLCDLYTLQVFSIWKSTIKVKTQLWSSVWHHHHPWESGGLNWALGKQKLSLCFSPAEPETGGRGSTHPALQQDQEPHRPACRTCLLVTADQSRHCLFYKGNYEFIISQS